MLPAALTVLWHTRFSPIITEPDGTFKHFGRIYLRAFKDEAEMEVWATEGESIKYKRVAIWPIAAMSGHLGPKRKQGDLQVPEGCYKVEKYNPNSAYHLSMGINYPNDSDKVRSDPLAPGSDIFIHGNAVSAGCMAMTDPVIDKLYALCQGSMHPDEVRVHIFPFRMHTAKYKDLIRQAEWPEARLWKELLPIYSSFEKNHRMPIVNVMPDGTYSMINQDW
ncbi:MAG: L,D-transpeptidase family protein [bacterium]